MSDAWDISFFNSMIERDMDFPVLLRLKKPCSDCAVECGLYTEISLGLKEMPNDIQEAVSAKWFCHNNINHQCEGNRVLIGAKP